jgi:hypothetical protein
VDPLEILDSHNHFYIHTNFVNCFISQNFEVGMLIMLSLHNMCKNYTGHTDNFDLTGGDMNLSSLYVYQEVVIVEYMTCLYLDSHHTITD